MSKHARDSIPDFVSAKGAWRRRVGGEAKHRAERLPLLGQGVRFTLRAEYRALGIDPALIDIIEERVSPPVRATAHLGIEAARRG